MLVSIGQRRQRQRKGDAGSLRPVLGRNIPSQLAQHIHDKEQAETSPRLALARHIGLAERGQNSLVEARPPILHGNHQPVAAPRRDCAQPVRRGFEGVVEHVEDHLLDRGVGHHRRIGIEVVFPRHRQRLARGVPFLHQPVEKAAHGGADRTLAAGIAGRHQDTGNDVLAALDLRLHLLHVARHLAVSLDRAHMAPVGQNDRDGGERRAEFVCGARRQQAHAHDMVFLGRALAQIGEEGVALAQIAVDARHEQHDQPGRQHEADEHAADMQFQQIVAVARHGDRLEDVDQENEAHRRRRHQDPGGARGKQRCAQRDLQEVERHEGIGRSPAVIELDGQRRHVEDQRDEELRIGDGGAAVQHQKAEAVQRDEEQHHEAHRHERQRDPVPVLRQQDCQHLSRHGQPSQLDEQEQVLAVGRVGIGRRDCGRHPVPDRRCHHRRSGSGRLSLVHHASRLSARPLPRNGLASASRSIAASENQVNA